MYTRARVYVAVTERAREREKEGLGPTHTGGGISRTWGGHQEGKGMKRRSRDEEEKEEEEGGSRGEGRRH